MRMFREWKIGLMYTLTFNLVCYQMMVYFGKLSKFYTAEVSISWRRRAHDSTCIMGSGDSHGADDVVDVDASSRTLDDDSMSLYLGYYDV
jgi:hypothetical protein